MSRFLKVLTRRIITHLIANLPLIFILTLGFVIFIPILSFFPEGDDFLFLWHIRVPVNIIVLPFYGWEEPIAGRFGYGQAWYGAIIYQIFGFQPLVFNLFGVICRLIVTLAVYKFCLNLTGKKIIGLLSALIFTVTSTGINGIVNLFIHFSMIFLSLFLFGSYKLIQGLEEKSISKLSLGAFSLLLGNYLYTIRAIGIILIPFWTILRVALYTSLKHKLFSLILAIILVLASIYMVTNFIPGASSYASETLIRNSDNIAKAIQRGNFEYIRSFLVSSGLMFFPREFYSSISEFFKADLRPSRYLMFWSLVVWILIYMTFSLPTLFTKKRGVILISILGLLTGILWSSILYILKRSGITFYYGSEIVTVTLGIQIFILSVFVGLQNLITTPKIGALLVSAITASLLFYIPNWLHDPVIISATESRYFTVSSGFTSIVIGILLYILLNFGSSFKKQAGISKKIRIIYILLTILFAFTITYFHLTNTNKILQENKSIRRADIIESHWNFVRSRVDFTKRPLIVVVWADTQIDNAKREFFRHQSLGLIGNLVWDYNLTDQLKLFYSYQDSVVAICGWKNRGIEFDFNNFYEFRLTDQREIIDRSKEGRERLKTWQNFCSDPTKKGIEVSS